MEIKMSKIKGVVGDLVRKFGVKFVLNEISSYLENKGDNNERQLAKDIDRAVKDFERREK